MTAMDAYQQATLAILLFYVENILLSGDKSIILPPLRASLESKYNTIECASELRSYYKSRPEMRSYTLETELPRADYVVLVNDAEGKTQELTTTQEIQEYFASNISPVPGGGNTYNLDDETEDIILRASNQSILADIVTVLSGDDRLIRTQQFFITGVATKCQFCIDLRKDEYNKRGVTVISTLLVSIPSGNFDEESNARLNLANIHVRVQFYPSSAPGDENQVQYEICSLEPLLSLPRDEHLLLKASKALAKDLKEIEEMNASLPGEEQYSQEGHTQEDEHNVQRDNYFKQVLLGYDNQTISQSIDASKLGLRNALKQIDEISNVTSKFTFLATSLSKNVVQTNTLQQVMLDAAQEEARIRYQIMKGEEELNRLRNNEPQPTPGPPPSHLHQHAARSAPPPRHPPPPGPPPRHPPVAVSAPTHQQTAATKSKPIIGGFLMAGLSKLASNTAAVVAAAAAEEEGEAMKVERQHQQQRGDGGGEGIHFYRKEEEVAVEQRNNMQHHHSIGGDGLTLYRRNDNDVNKEGNVGTKSAPTLPHAAIPEEGEKLDELNDDFGGWSDDEDLDFDDSNDDDNTAKKEVEKSSVDLNKKDGQDIKENDAPRQPPPPPVLPPSMKNTQEIKSAPQPPPPPSHLHQGKLKPATTAQNKSSIPKEDKEDIEETVFHDYNHENGIIPTRKRWRSRRMFRGRVGAGGFLGKKEIHS
uniref:Uncharacterized protein n=1 Tax=Ditylum brightwellii TaxID=49249 RepID=A0A7S1YZ93_9STRA|mmetsp:Transcript_20573/g.30549  ORF Transcript_20573/g.30549 Transcript_20573/m.30549 type:complete len:703 (+) Transcript_20573:54-2162(+)